MASDGLPKSPEDIRASSRSPVEYNPDSKNVEKTIGAPTLEPIRVHEINSQRLFRDGIGEYKMQEMDVDIFLKSRKLMLNSAQYTYA